MVGDSHFNAIALFDTQSLHESHTSTDEGLLCVDRERVLSIGARALLWQCEDRLIGWNLYISNQWVNKEALLSSSLLSLFPSLFFFF